MKKKQTTYLLLVVVAAIWGYIFYKFFNDLKGKNDTNYAFQTQPNMLSINQDTLVEDKFVLMLDYRDPFLGKIYHEPAKKLISKPKAIAKISVVFPKISYSGMIINKEENKRIAMVSIDNISHMVKQNEEVSGIKFLKFTKDSIWVTFSGQKKSFRK